MPRCICAEIPTVPTRTRIVILRHALEIMRPSNTARIAALALSSCELYDYAALPPSPLPASLGDPDTWLLYPGGEPGVGVPRQRVVADGTWSQARPMTQRIPQLRGLPRLSLPPPRGPVLRMRKQRTEDGMATLEAIARAIEVLEGPDVARPLDELFAEVVRRSL